jgi:hypothetical protein
MPLVIKQDLNKLFIAYSFNWSTKLLVKFDFEGTKKKKKLKICIDFHKLNLAMKKGPYPFFLLNKFWML